MHKIHLDHFEGPLDLLLELIEKEKLDITTVSLARVTDEYLRLINQEGVINAMELADFLVIAARLIYIKSKALLPYLVLEEEEGSLEDQLKIYREYYEASKVLAKIISRRKFTYVKEKLSNIDLGFQPPKNVTTARLAQVFRGILGALEPLIQIPKEVIRKTVSIKEKIEHLRKLITEKARVGFKDFLRQSKTRMETVVSFLALLELMKQRIIDIEQKGLFEEIEIKSLSH